ncbi:hypothetical protein TKK_0001871 [Trichogramma kaykai]|uniref:Protein stoned-A n=1 Tax=Trichogramma kaykai TaxID=54128 RepID=A0ABD2XFK1_9HYME
MHKLAKGLNKKKKKQKKGKKGEDDDEFDPEELERYRRERAEAQAKLAAEAAESGDGKPATNNDEWSKFAALTSGVDSILKKTQDDLDRIKSTSFFQRKAVEPEPDPEEAPEVVKRKEELAKRYAGFDKDGNPIEIKEDEDKVALKVNEDGIVELPEDDEAHEDSAEEDIFDTTYIDALQNIEVQLAYIPDSPTQEELGDDPFDTTNADVVLKTVDKTTGKKLVSLGNAVEVLAGRIDHKSTCKISKNRPRVQTDLLLDDFEVAEPSAVTPDNPNDETKADNVPKTLLDDDSDLPDIPVDLTKLPPIIPPRPVTPAVEGGDPIVDELLKPLDISEFEAFNKTVLDEIPVLNDEEFDLDGPAEPLVLEEAEDPFAEKESEDINLVEDISFVAATFIDEEDPFDTTIAENILPGKTELKFIEKELEQVPKLRDSSSVTQILKGTQVNLGVVKKDLLGGSSTDLSKLSDQPIKPAEELSYVDPFDTSSIQDLPPGRTELKFIEKEILGEKKSVLDTLDDDDFDPRADEVIVPQKKKPPPRPAPIKEVISEVTYYVTDNSNTPQEPLDRARKPSRPEVLDISSKVVAFDVPPTNLLASDSEEKNLPGKPLTPYYPQKSIEEVIPSGDELEESEVDPFDTSFVASAPGKTELKLIESELLNEDPSIKAADDISDSEFDPRSDHPVRRVSDVVSSAEVIETLVNKRKALDKRQDSILDTEAPDTVFTEPLEPNVKPSTIEEEVEQSYGDPFDTSHAEVPLPGKAELKLLENELNQVPDPGPIRIHPVIEQVAKRSVVEEDLDFDPRAGEEKKDILCLDSEEGPADRVLTPIQNTDLSEDDKDPFDTSFASIDPGKTELKLLESELIDQ